MTDNPLYDLWCEVYGADAAHDCFERDRRYEHLPDDVAVDQMHTAWERAFHARRQAIERWAFAVPSPAVLELIAGYSPIVELGAGTGYWADQLRRAGADVVAYDVMADRWGKWFPGGLVAPVEQGGVERLAEHGDRTLLMVWPFMDDMAVDGALAHARAGGRRVVYVGEGPGGCTASIEFFELMDEQYHEIASMPVPQWEGIHDHLTVYERQDAPPD